jgi:chorismate synthase
MPSLEPVRHGAYTLRDLQNPGERRDCEDAARRCWGIDDLEIIPSSALTALQHGGNLLAGAIDASGRVVGFVLGFLSRNADGAAYVHSHQLAVVPEHRGRGLGRALKWYQRDWCLMRGIDHVEWTFDPAQAPNANLNMEHLGAHVRHYETDFYGTLGGALSGGVATDRLVAEWPLVSPRVSAKARGEHHNEPAVPPRPDVALAADLRGMPGEVQLGREGPVRVAVPTSFTRLIEDDASAAQAWRLAVRTALTHYLERGFVIRRHAAGCHVLYPH